MNEQNTEKQSARPAMPHPGPGHGPRGRGGPQGMEALKAINPKIFGRLVARMMKGNALRWAIILAGMLLSVAASVAGSLFLQILIDDYITPFMTQANPDISALFRAISVMACIYLAGMIGTASIRGSWFRYLRESCVTSVTRCSPRCSASP